MLSVIILGHEAEDSKIEQAVGTVKGAFPGSEIVLAAAPSANRFGTTFVDSRTDQPGSILQRAAAAAAGNRLLVLTAGWDCCAEELMAFAQTTTTGSLTWARLGGSDVPELNPGNLVAAVCTFENWPLELLAADAELLQSCNCSDAGSFREALARLVISAVSAFCAVELSSVEFRAPALSCFTEAERSRLLSEAVNSNNIEDLFPNHAWESYEQECAAACYHTLAAQFIRFGSMDLALECLGFSDQLEDSPRSLALKALIALGRGETLGAVANLVSSLQEYETRKRNEDQRHYLTFTPSDLERVNANLHRGLDALNKRDNDTALSCFARAVFSFDDFYSRNSVDSLPKQQH